MSAEASDQAVKIMLQGVEVSAKIAGKASKHLIALLWALMQGQKKISGNTSIAKIVTQSKNIRIFEVKDEDLSRFKELAKKYGILYSVIRDKNLGDGFKDIMVMGEDAAKLQRVFDKMGYGDVDHGEQVIENDDKKKQASRQEPESQKSRQEPTDMDKQQAEQNIQSAKTMPTGEYDLQPDPVNGFDGKDPSELPPANKKELADKMHDKNIGQRKNLAEGFLRSQEKTKTKAKTIQRNK